MKSQNLSKTGDKCPKSGEWLVLEDNSSLILLKEGDEMPPFKGRSVQWMHKDSNYQVISDEPAGKESHSTL